ncbi:MAG: OmpA family protein [Treponema sp.]|nr:OmpA family protein [Treponema sp.]
MNFNLKKLQILAALLVLLCLSVYAQTSGQEEVDYLLFLPNSSSGFVDAAQANIQLDNLSKYLTGKNLAPGQICIYGYAAEASNNIDPVILSGDRASFVINELVKRGVKKELFADAVGYGSVDLWGSNTSESTMMLNRRVRIVIDGNVVTPAEVKTAEVKPDAVQPDVVKPVQTPPVSIAQPLPVPPAETKAAFPWWLLLLLLLAVLLLIFILAASKKKKPAGQSADKPAAVTAVSAARDEASAAPVIAAASVLHEAEPAAAPVIVPAAASAAVKEITVNIEEEIRIRAYELYLLRGGQNGNAETDWYTALPEVCARYTTRGYRTYAENGTWWAGITEAVRYTD